jgi:hypothetical protein
MKIKRSRCFSFSLFLQFFFSSFMIHRWCWISFYRPCSPLCFLERQAWVLRCKSHPRPIRTGEAFERGGGRRRRRRRRRRGGVFYMNIGKNISKRIIIYSNSDNLLRYWFYFFFLLPFFFFLTVTCGWTYILFVFIYNGYHSDEL